MAQLAGALIKKLISDPAAFNHLINTMHFLLNDNYHCFSDTTAKNTLSYLQFASARLSFFSLKV